MTDIVERAKAVLDGQATPSASLCAELVAEIERVRAALKAECQAADNAERQARDYERDAR
ncbi:hypothetical protein [Mycolicibacterium conceptionense]|uniref:hypothetical protein n=1 Tax=Mycolicibacterium conceptionense TaxID=451644 RepID=UPI00096C6E55|nr:hypothetical protein [Mycolicibacterium conceptionense]OMB79258.1 hypothetical protein A5743_14225 [Mycolicibacterium conceptionense]